MGISKKQSGNDLNLDPEKVQGFQNGLTASPNYDAIVKKLKEWGFIADPDKDTKKASALPPKR